MAWISNVAIQPDTESNRLLDFLEAALPDADPYLIRYHCDKLGRNFRNLSSSQRHRYLAFLRDMPEKLRDWLLRDVPPSLVEMRTFPLLNEFHLAETMKERGYYLAYRLAGSPYFSPFDFVSFHNNGAADTNQARASFDMFYNLLETASPDDYRHLIRDQRDGICRLFFALAPVKRCHFIDLLHHKPEKLRDYLDLHPNSSPVDAVKSIFYALEEFGYETWEIVCPPSEKMLEDEILKKKGFCIVFPPDMRIISAANDVAPKIKWLSDPLAEKVGSFQGSPELARDGSTLFSTCLGTNGGVIITLISKLTGNNRQGLLTEIMESFAAFCAVVGFFASLAGLYLSTYNYKPKKFPFDYEPEDFMRDIGFVGGLATAFAFTAGVLLLLPNNLFRGITMGLACGALVIPILIKRRSFSGADPALPVSV